MLMTSYPIYMMSHTLCVWQQKLYIWLETILSAIRPTVYVITPLCRRHHTSYVSITGGICMPSCALHMTPYPPFKRTTLSIYDLTCPLLMTKHALYIVHVISCVWYHINYTCDITQCLYLWHHTLYAYDISTLYGIAESVMKTQPLCNFIATMTDFTSRVSTSQPLSVWHHMHYMWHHIHNLGQHTTLCMRSGPHYLTSLPLYLGHHTHRIDNITATIWMTSHPIYL